jgi:hypothetical protein
MEPDDLPREIADSARLLIGKRLHLGGAQNIHSSV